ncbi:hypothetical protein EXE46_09620 [Halorubrum sp. GN11_10-6_MGM]|uniref:DUF6276 family protein n=1 Tax=Halorubrum sp. GN11_10-6_MGM TaxID=2518112 RepID=UPI0010F6A628|nr:DUF6276 family protein [Halorubrum sp. GN11_10-6_MGM]TKX74350.1 hypothetical protein EXE46_09620 [Halorubrum sp. GN11_10-6_MGM]
MSCPHCDAAVVAFAVPPALREHAPAESSAICTRCLRVASADEAGVAGDATDDPDLARVDPAFPSGEGGVALALCCGKLESFALNRASIEALIRHAEGAGADVFAFLGRLDAADAAFDLDRRRKALLDAL